MKNLRNFTPHEINFYRREDTQFVSAIRKHIAKQNSSPYLSVPSEGMLSIEFENEEVENDEFPVPVCRKFTRRMDRLPKIDENDIVIVSAIYANYRKIMDSAPYPLYTVNDTVYNENGKPIGCLGLIVQ